jgi:hypothetical protein
VGVTVVVALGEALLGNHQDGTSPLSFTPEGPTPTEDWPITSILPQTGHLVRFPTCWSSALNLRPQVHETEIIATTSGWVRLMFTWTQKAVKRGNLDLNPARRLTKYTQLKATCGILQRINGLPDPKSLG